MTDPAWIDAALVAARPRAVGALLRYFRELDLAEEAFQDACLKALQSWPVKGPPRDPAAWLIFVGRNAGVDGLRRRGRQTAAKSREGAATYPNDNDLETWIQAFTLAPQLPAVRLGFAAALIQADQREAAIALLTPLANAPHGGDAADIALALIETARSGGEAPPPEALEAPVEPDMPPPGPSEEPASPDTPTP